MFMLELVPEPVWKTSTGKWSRCSPAATAAAASSTALGDVGVEHLELAVGPRGRLLHQRQGAHQAGFDRRPADREVLHCALGLRPPQGVGGDAHLAHRVALDPKVLHPGRLPARPHPVVAWLVLELGESEVLQDRRHVGAEPTPVTLA